jgi:putative sterol carrier protein
VLIDPGPLARQFSVGVLGGRAEPLAQDADADAATVTLTMTALDFVRLGCGRVGGAQALAAGSVGVEGDAALGQAVLDTMNFMF